METSELNVSALCCDVELSGYDKLAGKIWIYPVTYPVRDYQFNIIKSAITKNTLVSLPTGLGKTFIAAVLMYNFYRWYPMGKIIFVAPTRPLIAQQIEACYNIIAMPPQDTIEMTGNMNVNLRKQEWQTRRVFFATPQVVQNDIKSGICPAEKIRCLVVDEAHRAKKNYAYCHIVSALSALGHRTYRILALSATPGSRIYDVIQVVKNLQIAHLELRTENCIDVAPYCCNRNINTITVPLGPKLSMLRDTYMMILDHYTRKLKDILNSDVSKNLSKGRILMIYKEFKSRTERHPQHGMKMKQLSQLITMYAGLERLVGHGSRAFLKFFNEHPEKTWIQSNQSLKHMLDVLRDRLGNHPQNLESSDTTPEIPRDYNFGHPKFDKMKEIIVDHFNKAKEKNEDTRAIVFCEYQDTVRMVACALRPCAPLVRPHTFVGRSRLGEGGKTAMTQHEQLRVMQQFRAGVYNVLVATCVAEEGLDVGSVDLIVCFDVATRSPVRLVQRCGRTGRERAGQVYFLVTEGREQQILRDSMEQRDSLKTKILQSAEVQQNLYDLNPRMIPYDFMPRCEKISITVRKKQAQGKRKTLNECQEGSSKQNQKRRHTLHNPTFRNIPNNLNSNIENFPNHLISNIENIPNSSPLEQITTGSVRSSKKKQNKATKLISAFLSPKKEDIKKSIVVPSSQNHALCSQSANNKTSPLKTKMKKTKATAAKNMKKHADIRAHILIGSKCSQTQNRAKLLNELRGPNADLSTKLLDLLIHLKTETTSPKTCYICSNICNCEILQNMRDNAQNIRNEVFKLGRESNLPDIELIKNVGTSAIQECIKTETKTGITSFLQKDNINSIHFSNDSHSSKRWCDNSVNKPGLESVAEHLKSDFKNILYDSNNFDVGNAEDIFATSPPKEAGNTNKSKDNDVILLHSTANFDLGSFDDIVMVNNENPNQVKQGKDSERVSIDDIIDLTFSDSPEHDKDYAPPYSQSPSILSGSHNSVLNTGQCSLKSPILSSQSKMPKKSVNLVQKCSPISKAKKQLNLSNPSNSMLSITQTIDLINSNESERAVSPVLLIAADQKKKHSDTKLNNSNTCEEKCAVISNTSPHTPNTSVKRKFDDDIIASSYFNKKQRVDDLNVTSDCDGIQNRILSGLTINGFRNNIRSKQDTIDLNCNISPLNFSTKDNKTPEQGTKEDTTCTSNLADKFSYTPKHSRQITKKPSSGRKLNFNKKMPKERKNEFIDAEAQVSGSDSGDELSDDSGASQDDFVADGTLRGRDIHAIYLHSVKSPHKIGAFKIPTNPPRSFKDNVYSQYEEQDSYELGSFCVDSNIEITQARDLSHLEELENILEEERRRKRSRREKHVVQENGDSPILKPKNKTGRKYNVIDSDDSS